MVVALAIAERLTTLRVRVFLFDINATRVGAPKSKEKHSNSSRFFSPETSRGSAKIWRLCAARILGACVMDGAASEKFDHGGTEDTEIVLDQCRITGFPLVTSSALTLRSSRPSVDVVREDEQKDAKDAKE
jgi:hypothetical protein